MNAPEVSFLKQLRADGVVGDEVVCVRPLSGGVSSEIYCIEEGGRKFVVKRALEKLNVEADWFADTGRNVYEQAYLRYVDEIAPGSVPSLLDGNFEAGYFCMEYLEGYHNWKSDLLHGSFDVSLAFEAGFLLGRIHQTSWGDTWVAQSFDTIENFDQLRIDPYLRAIAAKHPDIATQVLSEAERLRSSRQCLIHGDFSPKNMLHLGGRLVLLDCEVACYADAAFDLAFLLNHILLKALYHRPLPNPLASLFDAVVAGYREANPEHTGLVEVSAGRLLPMLVLARVDGKSPVEYLTPEKQSLVRDFAKPRILEVPQSLQKLSLDWFAHL